MNDLKNNHHPNSNIYNIIKSYNTFLEKYFKDKNIQLSQSHFNKCINNFFIDYNKNNNIKKQKAGLIIFNSNNQFLLIKGKKSKKFGFPKGDVLIGETLTQAATRETLEESGFDINKIKNKKELDMVKLPYAYYFIIKIKSFPHELKTNDKKEIDKITLLNIEQIKNIKNSTIDIKYFITKKI